MKVLAIIATAAAVRLNAEEGSEKKIDTSKWPSANAIFKYCNTNNEDASKGVLDADEVLTCLKKSGMTFE